MSDLHDAAVSILHRLDIAAEYSSWGVEFSRSTPTDAGWLACYRHGSGERDPSAAVCVAGSDEALGRYTEHSGELRKLSFWEAAALLGPHPDWRQARKFYADKVGIPLPAAKKDEPVGKKTRPQFSPMPWVPELAEKWCRDMGGISLAAVEASGAKLGKNVVGVTVIAWEVVSGGELRGWYTRNINAHQPLKLGSITAKNLLTKECSPAGWIGDVATLADADVVFWVEGVPDALAGMSAIRAECPDPKRYAVITASHGASSCPPAAMLEILKGKTVVVIGDADEAGVAGADMRAGQAARITQTKLWKLPYPIEAKSGKDLRDWLLEGHRMGEILGEYQNLPDVAPADSPPPQAARKADAKAAAEKRVAQSYVQSVLDKLQLVVGSTNSDGEISIWDGCHSRWRRIKAIDKWSYEGFLLLTGEAGRKLVCSRASDSDERIPWALVRQEISVIASTKSSTSTICGPGIWSARLAGGVKDPNRIVIVTHGWAAVYDVERQHLEKLDTPVYEDAALEIGTGTQWVDFDRLKSLLQQAKDLSWAQGILVDCEAMFRSWRWRTDTDPTVMVGLVLSTWLQDLWPWCPHVAIAGASNTGKSVLLQTLSSMFLPLCLHASAHSTVAGIRQAIGNSRPPLLIDEWDSSPVRDKLLTMFRDSSRGASRFVGSSDQKGGSLTLKQTVWVSGIAVSLEEAADQTRFIRLELRPPLPHEYGKLDLRSDALLQELGEQLMAIALTYSGRAAQVLTMLGMVKPPSAIHPRLVEGFNVPAAILTAVAPPPGGILQNARDSLLTSAEGEVVESDEEALLEAILSHTCDAGGNLRKKSLGQLLDIYNEVGSEEAFGALEREGVIIHWQADQKFLGFSPRALALGALRWTGWTQSSIREVLARTEGSEVTRIRCSSGQIRIVRWDWKLWHTQYGSAKSRNEF